MTKHNLPITDRFWSKVDKNGPIMPNMDTPCWIWIASKDGCGYGDFYLKSVPKRTSDKAHRFSWKLENGPIPEGLLVCHHCDNPSCIRPDHLFSGTQIDNMQDCAKKGRHPDFTGEKSGMDKTNREAVNQIRNMYATGNCTLKELGLKFNLTPTNVQYIIARKIWK